MRVLFKIILTIVVCFMSNSTIATDSNSYLDKLLLEDVKPGTTEGFNFSIKGDKR